MTFKTHGLIAVLGAAMAFPLVAQAQQLNELAVKDPAKHEACYTQANEKNLRREARWKFMIDCMKK